ncbi:hypothetical protein DFH08DRAFT_815314 [Mycena albidolilacea]|uniref:Uncharacterized protein n=1 Tax=Mycena albidolilacea TaxID=1033008 RepID=A0AAD7EKM3_9AGAR|nr:hypothetical protein DFH08DRAFT_815314 [Mycena albidolilacea]
MSFLTAVFFDPPFPPPQSRCLILSEIKAYRKFARWLLDDASTKQLIAYRSYILADQYVAHIFFSLENPDVWINPTAFQGYMDSTRSSTPTTSRAPSRATSSISRVESQANSRVQFIPSSGASSEVSYTSSDMLSRPSSSMSMEVIQIHDSDSDDPGSAAIPAAHSTASLGNPFAPPIPKLRLLTSPFPISHPSVTVPDTKPNTKKKGKGKGKTAAAAANCNYSIGEC